jgi:CPA2 family monovalent cation:H+ antiporter-2
MPHDVSLTSTIAVGFGLALALALGCVAVRFGLPARVGYLVAGIAIGPATPGFVGDGGIVAQLSEIGVMLPMSGVGLHFSLDDLPAVRRIAVPGATAICIAFAAAWLFSVSFGLGAFFAGTVMRESEFSRLAADESLSLRDAFAVLFFVSIGMLFDPAFLVERPLQVAATVAIVVLGSLHRTQPTLDGHRHAGLGPARGALPMGRPARRPPRPVRGAAGRYCERPAPRPGGAGGAWPRRTAGCRQSCARRHPLRRSRSEP